MILILVGASRHSPNNKMSISNVSHKNVFESNVRKWEASRSRTAESSGNEKKTTLTSLSILFVIIWVLVGVRTSVLVWQGVGSAACAKGKNWPGLKAVQYFGVVFALRNASLAAPPTRDFVLVSVPVVSLSPHSPSTMVCAPLGPTQERVEVAKGDAEWAGVLNPTGLNVLMDSGHHQFSSILCFSFPCA